MGDLIHQIGSVVLPVILCVLAGFTLVKLRQPFDTRVVGSLVTNIGYPALIIGHLSSQHISPEPFLQMLAAAATAIACMGAISFSFLRLVGLPYRVFLAPLSLSNVGNVGLPICLLALGPEGLVYALAYVIVVLVCMFTLGIWLPMGKVTWSGILANPVLYSVIIGISLLVTDTPLPNPLHQTLDLLGGLAIPLMLLTLGSSLATLPRRSLLRGSYLATFHIAMAAAVAYGLVEAFGMTGTLRKAFIIECLMPVAVGTYLWVEIYRPQQDAEDVASLVFISTLMTIAVLPLALAFWV